MISVCLASHNGEKYIKDQIFSILKQIGKEDELIISDDGSYDNTIKIIDSINDPRIILIRYSNDLTLSSIQKATMNFQNALKHAKGEYIFLSDQDDVWLDDKVNIMLKYLKTYSYAVSDCYITDELLNIISETRYTKASKITKNKYLALFKSTPYQGSCAAFRREVLLKALPFPPKVQSHDRWIGFVASFFFSVKIVPERLILYRRNVNSTSTAILGISNQNFLSRIFNRLYYITSLIRLIYS